MVDRAVRGATQVDCDSREDILDALRVSSFQNEEVEDLQPIPCHEFYQQ